MQFEIFGGKAPTKAFAPGREANAGFGKVFVGYRRRCHVCSANFALVTKAKVSRMVYMLGTRRDVENVTHEHRVADVEWQCLP